MALFTKNAKVELLRRVPLFERCSKSELAEIAAIVDELELPAGRSLTNEGARGKEFVVIVDGAAEVRRKGRKLNTLRSGDFVGEIALLTGKPRTATVTTTKPSRILVLTAPAFRRVLQEMPSISLKVLDALARRIKD